MYRIRSVEDGLILDFSDEIFPHCVWEKKLTGIIRKIRSASPKSPSDFPNVSQIFWCGLPHQKTSDNSDVIFNKILTLKTRMGVS